MVRRFFRIFSPAIFRPFANADLICPGYAKKGGPRPPFEDKWFFPSEEGDHLCRDGGDGKAAKGSKVEVLGSGLGSGN
jgi:hypothetical protein